MIEFGKTLSDARTAKGLSVSQIAESTHMMASIVKDLENEDFSRIVAPIYGRGFVKLYCEAVGIDPKPLVAEFMEIYNGNRIPAIKERPVSAPAPEPTSAPEPAPEPAPVVEPIAPPPADIPPQPVPPSHPIPGVIPTAAEPPLADFGPLFDPKPAPQTAPRPQSPAAPASSSQEQPREPRLSRYASPLHEHSEPKPKLPLPSFSIPPSVWRIAILVIVLVGVLWALFLGVRKLYRITNDQTQPSEEARELPQPAPQEQSVPKAAEPARAAKTPEATAPKESARIQPASATTKPTVKATTPAKTVRTPQHIPSLYLD